jgi:hypothetical protein
MNHGTSAAAALLLALLPVTALAQDVAAPSISPEREAARAKVRTACAEDVQRFCANIERGKGATRACLDQHQKNLSAACSTARAERAAVRAAEKRM